MTSGGDVPVALARFGRQALDALPAAAFISDLDQRFTAVNRAFEELTGYTEAELLGRSCWILHGPDTDPTVVAQIHSHLAAGKRFADDVLSHRADGRRFWSRMSIGAIRDASGAPLGYVSIHADASEDMERRGRLEEQRETAETLLEVARQLAVATRRGAVAQTIADAMISLGLERSAVALLDDTRTSFRMTAVSGWPADLQSAAADFSARLEEQPELAELLTHPRQRYVTAQNASEGARREFAAYRVAAYLVTPVVAGSSAPHGFLLVYWPSSPPREVPSVLAERLAGIAGLAAVALDNVQLIERIQRDANEDALTGLANRAALHRELARALDEGGTSSTGVVFSDIDHFKRINDALGHVGADELLRQVAARLRSLVRTGDTVARPGGDEFVIVLQVRGQDDVQTLVERIQERFQDPFEIHGTRVYVSLSTGSATTDGERTESSDVAAESLLMTADSRMYEVKRTRHSSPGVIRGLAGLDLDTALHEAIENNAITAHFQPQYDLRTGHLSGFEALARWYQPDTGWVSPAVFIPLAEDNGTISAIGGQVLEQACRFIDRATALRAESLHLQVNVSTRELARPRFAERALAVLAQWPNRRWRLTFEVTESALIIDRPRVEDALEELRRHGVGIAIDDFGSGYSSLSQLQELPATEIKIDRSFIHRQGAVGEDVLRAIIALGRSLDLLVVAEGVETEQQLATVRRLGCDRAQGFLLGPALPLEAASGWSPTIEGAVNRARSRAEEGSAETAAPPPAEDR